MMSPKLTFNGSHIVDNTSGAVTYTNDPINYCPYCGGKVQDDFKYCPKCSKEIPRTHTGSNYIIHWNLDDGTSTYPALTHRIPLGNEPRMTC